jgi:hypothetical protein
MKNIRLAIFVVGTTVMLWMGCSNSTWDKGVAQAQGYSLVEKESEAMDSVAADGAGTMDEMDEVKLELR